ncbi:MAG: OPT/YSL family transporter [Planctomycetes bacterium]|nr:OPT/YSL family transporter [Planctomycetota bacterium]
MENRRRYPEISLSAVVFAVVIGVVMNAAITLVGLRIGFTILGSAIAALLGFGILRGLLGRGSILETNIAQTIASGVNSPNAGVIFTVPVLVLLGLSDLRPSSSEFWLLTVACVTGGLLGTAFIIPLRKQMLDIDRLRFPTPTGVATILKSPGAGPRKAAVLVLGLAIGALIQLPKGLPNIRTTADVADLDALVASERVSPAAAERTRMIRGWVDGRRAPEEIVEKGRLEAQRLELAHRVNEGEALGEELEAARAAIEAAAPEDISPKLAHAVFLATSGDLDWSDLRDRNLGWAADHWPGYADLDWRLPETRDDTGTLTVRCDRDGNGRPDLLLTDDEFDFGRWVGLPDEVQLVFAIAPFAIGAGFLTGQAGLFVLVGGILAFLFLNPLAFNLGWMPATTQAHEVPGLARGLFNRHLGIGLLLGGAFMGIIASLPAIREALRSVIESSRTRSAGGSDELGMKPIAIIAVAGFIVLFVLASFVGNQPFNTICPVSGTKLEAVESPATLEYAGYTIGFANDAAASDWDGRPAAEKDAYLEGQRAHPGWLGGLPSLLRAAIIALVGAVWIWFAGLIIAQCTGMTDWSPISGMALLTVVLVMLMAGTGAVFGAVLLGATLCVAITLGSDMMGDLKTGYLVGARPRAQQLAELSVVWLGPVVSMLTIALITTKNLADGGPAIGPGSPMKTDAPQAQALQAVITGIQGGSMPYALYILGAIVGGLLGLGAFSGLGVLVGLSMYLPFAYISTYGIGCVANIVLRRLKGVSWTEEWGVPLAAGLIVGDSVLDLTINAIAVSLG